MEVEDRIINIQLRLNALWYDLVMFSGLIIFTIVMLNLNTRNSLIFCFIVAIVFIILVQVFEHKEKKRIKND